MAAEPTSARYDHIDALRAIAALLVVWRHAAEVLGGDTDRWAVSFVDPGRVGIILFFAISGFVIPSSLRGTLAGGTRRFVIRRFFRLYPAYWLSIPVGWMAIHWLGGEPFAPREIIANTTMLQKFFGVPDVIGVYWTLAIELVFYAICLILFWCGIVHRAMTFCVFSALTALIAGCYARLSGHMFNMLKNGSLQSSDFWYQVGQHLVANPRDLWGDSRFLWLIFLSAMGLGALIRFWHDGKAGRFGKLLTSLAIACWAILFLIVPGERYVRGLMPLNDVCTYLSHIIPIIGFFFLSCFWKIHSRMLRWVGLVSYSLYLFHAPIIYTLHNLLGQHPGSAVNAIPASMLVIGAIFLSLGVAALIFRFIEKPMIDLSHRLTRFQPAVSQIRPRSEGLLVD